MKNEDFWGTDRKSLLLHSAYNSFFQRCLHEMRFRNINFRKDNSVAKRTLNPSIQPLIQEETFKPQTLIFGNLFPRLTNYVLLVFFYHKTDEMNDN